ncbi:MAG TPA: rubredoxin [Phnomibacter sp.]|nr:rubredoxin [Phnomibacter sp.]
MRDKHTIKFNFKGGVISPGDLLQLVGIARACGISDVSFGLRQQLLVDVPVEDYEKFIELIKQNQITNYEVNAEWYPNIMSSYPAEEIFSEKNWLSEGVYKDIFDSFSYQPRLKINISNNNQSFSPLLTGNINWVASNQQHFWYLIIRFPKTNTVYHWKELVYTNELARVSQRVEQLMLGREDDFIDNPAAHGDDLFDQVMASQHFITKAMDAEIVYPGFALPYYEGFNKYQDEKYWLGIYRRDEAFNVRFLEALCKLCLESKLSQICSTPWKSIIIKGIEKKRRRPWDLLLGQYQINVRHAANELNFQLEDNCKAGLNLKLHIVAGLNKEDVRTFGLCIGIKTRRKSEVFSSILVRRKPLFSIAGIGFFFLYDILCAKDYNPNERTGFVYSRNIPKFLVTEHLRRAVVAYYKQRSLQDQDAKEASPVKPERKIHLVKEVLQCGECLSVYDAVLGDAHNGIAPGTAFKDLPSSYTCPVCEAGKSAFEVVKEGDLFTEAV